MITESIKKTFCKDFKRPWEVYRAIYKATPCGPTIGFRVNGKWIYNDDLYSLPPWPVYAMTGCIDGVSVSSIVEGSDVEVPGEKLTGDFTEAQFWNLVEQVNKEATFYWDRDNSDWYGIVEKGDLSKMAHAKQEAWEKEISLTDPDGIIASKDLQDRVKYLISQWDPKNEIITFTHEPTGKKYEIFQYRPDWSYDEIPEQGGKL